MFEETERPMQFESVRTLVRYVDEDQAIIEIHMALRPFLPSVGGAAPRLDQHLAVLLELRSTDGFHDEQILPLRVRHRRGKVTWDIVRPKRWWPAGMGAQPLYELKVTLLSADEWCDHWSSTIGFTSVRTQRRRAGTLRPHMVLVVNGQKRDIGQIVVIDRVDEHRLLPAAGDTLLVVRDHYGPNVLYEAADRAGIMLVQCVPVHPEGRPESDVLSEVARLAAHPSLAGWFIGHLGEVSQRLARRLRRLDPTHALITDAADNCAA